VFLARDDKVIHQHVIPLTLVIRSCPILLFSSCSLAAAADTSAHYSITKLKLTEILSTSLHFMPSLSSLSLTHFPFVMLFSSQCPAKFFLLGTSVLAGTTIEQYKDRFGPFSLFCGRSRQKLTRRQCSTTILWHE
jgi:hypothetical protein